MLARARRVSPRARRQPQPCAPACIGALAPYLPQDGFLRWPSLFSSDFFVFSLNHVQHPLQCSLLAARDWIGHKDGHDDPSPRKRAVDIVELLLTLSYRVSPVRDEKRTHIVCVVVLRAGIEEFDGQTIDVLPTEREP